MRNNHHFEHDYGIALASIKDVLPLNRKKSVGDMDDLEVKDKLKSAIISYKSQKLRDIFINKMLRNRFGRHLPKGFEEQWQTQKEKTGLEGFKYPQKLEQFILFFHLVCLLAILVINTFNGFLDEFAAQDSSLPQVIVIKALVLLFQTLHLLMFCTRKTFSQGVEKIYLTQIIVSYFKSWRLIIDLVGILLNIFSLIFPTVMEIHMFFFLWIILILLFAAAQDLLRLETAYLRTSKSKLVWNLTKIAIFNILFAHFIATVLLGMARYDLNENWLTQIGTEMFITPWFEIYVSAFYWATTIMMTVGFGDLLPSTWREQYTTAFVEIFSCIVLAYNISEIGNIITKLRESNQRVMTKIAIFQKMLNRYRKKGRPLNQLLERRIYNYIRQSESEQANFEKNQKDELIENLPEHLKVLYYKEVNKSVFSQILFFANLKSDTLEGLAQHIRSRYYYPGEYMTGNGNKIKILEEGTLGLGYQRRGSAMNGAIMEKIYSAQKDPPILMTNQFLFLRSRIQYDIISVDDYSLVWEISLTDFLQNLKSSLIDNQFYFSVLHKQDYSDHQWEIVVCSRCSKLVHHKQCKKQKFPKQQCKCPKMQVKHSVFECPKLHYMPIKLNVVNSILYGARIPQKRTAFTRKKHSKGQNQALKQKTNLYKISQKFYNNQATDLSQYQEKQYLVNQQWKQLPQSTNRHKHISLKLIEQQKFEKLVYDAVLQYETGYRDEFWDLQCDESKNYDFYFPNDNPNRIVFRRVKDCRKFAFRSHSSPVKSEMML